MRKIFYSLIVVLLIVVGGTGYYVGLNQKKVEINQVSQENEVFSFYNKKISFIFLITRLENCMLASQNDLLYYDFTQNLFYMQRATLLVHSCHEIIENISLKIKDEERSFILGEVYLFFSGYLQTFIEILEIELRLTENSNPESIIFLDNLRYEKIIESRKFIERMIILTDKLRADYLNDHEFRPR